MNEAEIRDHLIALCNRGEHGAAVQACLEHREIIATHFAQWKTVPEPLRESEQTVESYVAGLLEVAKIFAEELQDPTLMAALTGSLDDGPSPVQRWHDELAAAQTLMQEGDFSEAAERLEGLVQETAGLQGSFVDRYLPVTLGMLGSAHFNQGRIDDADQAMERALAVSQDVGDAEGMEAYTTNLMELHRYRGDGPRAATYARRLADLVEETAPRRARRLRVRADTFESGEPRLRVVLRVGEDEDAEFELNQLDELVKLAHRDDQIRFMFERDRVGLALSATLTDEARALVDAGKPESAVAVLRRAMAIDPHDPGPHHELARLEMQRQRWDAAIEALRGVEVRVPGWPTVREDLALLEALRDGDVPAAMLTTLQTLEGSERPVRAKAEMASQALESLGDHARLWLALGKAQAAMEQFDDARDSFAEALEHAAEPSVRTRALVALAEVSEPGRVHDLVMEAIATDGDPVAAAAARLRLALLTLRAD